MIKYLERGMFPVYIGFCSTEKEYKTQLKKLGINDGNYSFLGSDHANATLHSMTSTDGKYLLLLCFDMESAKTRTPIEVAGLIAHESMHVWQQTRDYIGERDTKETEAYFVQYVSQFFMECYEEASKKRMKWGKY